MNRPPGTALTISTPRMVSQARTEHDDLDYASTLLGQFNRAETKRDSIPVI